MAFSGDIWVLNKLADLANRCGVSPTVANVELNLHFPEGKGFHYTLSMVDGAASTPDELAKVEKIAALLGLDEETHREFGDLQEVESAVDAALAVMPRARVREGR